MVEFEDESVAFPVVLYDGEREYDVGKINVHPMLDFKQFQKMLKETVGISYNNLTTYLVDRNVPMIPSERRKILITGKVNFSVIVLERNCYFLVVLKRSRRDRRRKTNKPIAFAPVVSPSYLLQISQNRFGLIDERLSSAYSLYYGDQFQDFRIMKENYMKSGLNWNHVLYSPVDASFATIGEAYSAVESGRSRALCKDCTIAEKQGIKPAFHFCVYDDVVAGGFRSVVGPICRPP
ncbi:hypothetical protein R6Q59_007637 [Mikania micrantha]|uniref:DUF7138 domain-containing protein n=1 Tax=Mikania micrantha TaxID=192012 RepID=A0A5N6Q3C7_9ASTR|nr:hypothetical protein E3N88_01326 [Mikania micrantha]